MSIGSIKIDAVDSNEILRIVKPLGIDAAAKTIEAQSREITAAQRQHELALQQARYEAAHARRQYDARDPANRRVASELERRWNFALETIQSIERDIAADVATRSPQLDEQQLGQLTTSFRWRHRFLTAPLGTKTKAVTGIVEASETFIRKSAKGSRTLKGRAPRKRATKATKAARSMEEHDAVLIVRDRHGAATDAVLADLTASTFEAVFRPSSPRTPCSSATAVTPTDCSPKPPASSNSCWSPGAASAPMGAFTFRTSTPAPAGSRGGSRASEGSHRGFCRTIWDGGS